MSSRPTPPKAGEIDPIKLFVIIIGAASVLIGGWCYFFLKSDLEDLERANKAAERSMERILAMEEQSDTYLGEFDKARRNEGGSSHGFFGNIRSQLGIARESYSIDADRERGSGRDYTQIVTTITIKSATWEQIVEYMREVERQSANYRVLDISGFRRVKADADADEWHATIQFAYRTQKQM